MNNNDIDILKGATPTMIWGQIADYLAMKGKEMKSANTKRMRQNNPITWAELDNVNKEIHEQLDYLITWDDKFKKESLQRRRKVKLTESDLHRIIKESVKTIIQEAKDTKILEIKSEAESKFESVVAKYDLPIKFDFKRNEDNYMIIGAHMNPDAITYENEDEYRAMCVELKRNGFILVCGPLMGWCEWEYEDDRLKHMYKIHTDRNNARIEAYPYDNW